MPKTPSVEDRLEDIAGSLNEAAKHLSDEAADAVTAAAEAVTKAAQTVRGRAESRVKTAARKAAEEVHEHPVASLAAAITAAAALIGVIAAAKARSAKS